MKNSTSVMRTVALACVAGIVLRRIFQKGHIFPGQVAIITGGSSGLGLSLTRRFGKAGLKLVLAARSKDDLEDARKQLLDTGSVSNEGDGCRHPA